MSIKSKFERRLEEIIGVEEDVSELLGELDDEGSVPDRKFEMVVYDERETAVIYDEESPNKDNKDLIDDYKYSRNILYGLIERGTAALEGSLMVAKESEHPRAYEVAGAIMKNISEMTKDLLALQKSLNPPSKGKQIIEKQTNVQIINNSSDQKDLKDILGELDDED